MKPSLALAGLLVAAVSAQGADPAAAIPGPPVARVALVGVDGLGLDVPETMRGRPAVAPPR